MKWKHLKTNENIFICPLRQSTSSTKSIERTIKADIAWTEIVWENITNAMAVAALLMEWAMSPAVTLLAIQDERVR